MQTFRELYERLREQDESVQIEAKAGSAIGRSVQETIAAFSNEPHAGGGYVLLGVTPVANSLFPDYEVVGVSDPDKLQAELATQCREMFSSTIRPNVTVERHEDKTVIVAYIPEAPVHEKPVHIKSKGISKGSYRRIGSTDQVCTNDDIAMFFQARGQRSPDEALVPDSTLSDIDENALGEYRRLRAEYGVESDLLEYDHEDLLHALGATGKERGELRLTLAGLVLFGKKSAIRRHLPLARVDYIRVEGRDWVPDPQKRYQTIEKLGPLVLTVPSVVAQILEDIPRSFSLAEDSIHRRDLPLVPRNVIREAVVNAVMHRSYQVHQAVQIIRYANRLEIINPGYSLVPPERLGLPGSSVARNPKIAAVFHDVGLAETKGTGVRAMREAMEKANLSHPLLESDRLGNTFTVRLLVHHLLTETDWQWLSRFKDCGLTDDEARALVVVREIGAIDNAILRAIAHVDTLTASNHLQRLRRLGLLEKFGNGPATYYKPTAKLMNGQSAGTDSSLEQQKSLVAGSNPATKPLVAGSDSSTRGTSPQGMRNLPGDLQHRVNSLGERSQPEELRALIRDLCGWQAFQSSQLQALLRRGQRYLVTKHLQPMIAAGELRYLYPDNPAHPRQAYVKVEK